MSRTSIERSMRRVVLSGPGMGARWSAVAFVGDAVDPDLLGRALADEVEAVERDASNWRPSSAVERLNAMPIGDWIALPPRLFEILEAATAIGRLSEGAFDIGVGDLVRAFGFGGGRRTPEPSAIAALAGRAAFDPPRALQLDPVGRRGRRLAPLTVDLAGIAKGYGVDRMARVMDDFGIASHLVAIDGEMRAGAAKPDGRPWLIGQERPDAEARALAGVVELTGAAIATSGDYRHVHEIGGRRVSHTMDPGRGAPLVGDLAQATVIAPTCMEADAWATALLVAGREAGAAMALRRGLTAILVTRAGETWSSLNAATGGVTVARGAMV